MITIDLRVPIKVAVPDAAGVDQEYDLVEGLNDVPPEVAEHWYVSKFTRPVRRVPRLPTPSIARPAMLPIAAVKSIADALSPGAEAARVSAPAAPVAPPATPPAKSKS